MINVTVIYGEEVRANKSWSFDFRAVCSGRIKTMVLRVILMVPGSNILTQGVIQQVPKHLLNVNSD